MQALFNKGQTSLELLIIIAFVMAACISIIADFNNAKEGVETASLVKTFALGELAEQDAFYYIDEIKGPILSGKSAYFEIYLKPAIPTNAADIENNIAEKIKQAKEYESVTVTLK